jgi:tetratricopeptide (TPR) repeat protein
VLIVLVIFRSKNNHGEMINPGRPRPPTVHVTSSVSPPLPSVTRAPDYLPVGASLPSPLPPLSLPFLDADNLPLGMNEAKALQSGLNRDQVVAVLARSPLYLPLLTTLTTDKEVLLDDIWFIVAAYMISHVDIGEWHLKQHQYPEALIAFEQSTESDPLIARGWRHLGLIRTGGFFSCHVDQFEAYRCFQRAHQLGDSDGTFYVSCAQWYGQGTGRNRPAAAQLFESNKDCCYSRLEYGVLLCTVDNRYYPHNFVQGRRICTEALNELKDRAEAGEVRAMHRLSYCYGGDPDEIRATGITPSDDMERKWLLRCAQLGNAPSQVHNHITIHTLKMMIA